MVIDGRKGDLTEYRQVPRIQELCAKYKTDGLMILHMAGDSRNKSENDVSKDKSENDGGLLKIPGQARNDKKGARDDGGVDFVMDFFNPDGSGGMMCGNGGRCIVAFADYLGLKPAAADGTWHFMAPDGPHEAKILQRPDGRSPIRSGMTGEWTVRLKMIDVQGVTPVKNGYFLNTGTRHYVEFRDRVDGIDMEKEAKPLRWDPTFQPEGTNVNFVERTAEGLKVRTFEKGVEGETLACGTGITASAIAAWWAEIPGTSPRMTEAKTSPGTAEYRLQCRRGDWLSVEFKKEGPERFTDVFLTGPAELVEILP